MITGKQYCTLFVSYIYMKSYSHTYFSAVSVKQPFFLRKSKNSMKQFVFKNVSIYMTTRSHTCVTLSYIRSVCTLSLHYPELLILHNCTICGNEIWNVWYIHYLVRSIYILSQSLIESQVLMPNNFSAAVLWLDMHEGRDFPVSVVKCHANWCTIFS